ncbi:glutathione S-transferase-like [Adelges cooleyi]|uniref:glutathione S-transferase-like n=1 Tax=Adelges cooleyi TaxID=133065 RepID=UPI0021808128|nr:glutathione S-transferase-like [Adelges cooleyi]
MTYKLTYFNIRGKAEPIRFILAYSGIDYEDNRIDPSTWLSLKPNAPFGQLPLLEIDGKVLNQSMAICRYLAKKAGLLGSDDWESLLVDIAVDNIGDFLQDFRVHWLPDTDPSKATKYNTLINESIPFYIDKFEQIVKNNNGYFVNGKLTWPDLFFVSLLDTLKFVAKKDFLEDKPNLNALVDKVLSLPRIKTWTEKRPKTDC